MSSLVTRLGYPKDTRALVVTADDFGLCHASTMGVLEALAGPVATSAGLIVPAPWSREAAAQAQGLDVGVQLTLTAELPRYRWGPITFAPSLLGGDGGFPATDADLHDHADPDEVRRECRAQLERAVQLGVEPTHLSVHGGALFAAPALFDVVAELAEETGLPLRLPDPADATGFGYPLHALADERGIAHPDFVQWANRGALDSIDAFCAGLPVGVTELVTHPAIDSNELRTLAPDATARVTELGALTRIDGLAAAVRHAGIVLLAWAAIRDVAGGSR